MNLEYPSLLLVAPLLIVLAFVYGWRSRSLVEKRRFPWFIASVVCLLIALANPYWSTVPSKERIKGVDLILVVDVSQSMFSADPGKPKRIELATKFIKNLLPAFNGSQIGLIYFSGDAQIGSPFTYDLQAISLFLDSISPGMSSEAGTKTSSIQETISQLVKNKETGKLPLILLFSDGEFFDSGKDLQNYVRSKNLRIFTYLCGEQKAAVLNYDLTGPVPNSFSTPQPASLKKLADAGQGAFFNLSKERTDKLFSELSKRVEDVVVQGQSVPDYRPVPFLVLSLLFLLIYQWIPFRQSSLKTAPLIVAIFLLMNVSMKKDDSLKSFQDALKDISAKKNEDALRKLKNLPPDFPAAEKQIAMGNAYYFSGKFDEAIRAYQGVLERNGFDSVARWNWEVALKRRAQQRERPPDTKPKMAPQNEPEKRNALLDYVDQLEREQRQKSNRTNIGKSDFAW
jgi:tetratricopeptide (TPR) repeat protein